MITYYPSTIAQIYALFFYGCTYFSYLYLLHILLYLLFLYIIALIKRAGFGGRGCGVARKRIDGEEYVEVGQGEEVLR